MSLSGQIACYESDRGAGLDGHALGKYMRLRYLWEAKHLKSEQHGASVFSIEHRDGGKLGTVKWYGRWRRYCFYPCEATFSADCLRDIATFLEDLF